MASSAAVTPESEYSPTPIPGKKGLSVIQVDAKGDQYLVTLHNSKAERHSDLKPVGYHNWTQSDGANNGMHLWTFILNDNNGGDLYHQGKNKKAKKVEEHIGRSFITDKSNKTLYYVDKKQTPWQIKSRNKDDFEGFKNTQIPLNDGSFVALEQIVELNTIRAFEQLLKDQGEKNFYFFNNQTCPS